MDLKGDTLDMMLLKKSVAMASFLQGQAWTKVNAILAQ